MAENFEERGGGVPIPPPRQIKDPLQIGGVTTGPGSRTRPPSLRPLPPGARPAPRIPPNPLVNDATDIGTDLFPSRPMPVAPPLSETQVLPPGFVEASPGMADLAPPPLPLNWNAILQSLGFFSGPASSTPEEIARRRMRDPLAGLR